MKHWQVRAVSATGAVMAFGLAAADGEQAMETAMQRLPFDPHQLYASEIVPRVAGQPRQRKEGDLLEPLVTALGPCYVHKGYFSFDPEHVASVPVDPETGLPPDVNPHPDGQGWERARQSTPAVICDDCLRKLNAELVRQKRPTIELASQRAARLR